MQIFKKLAVVALLLAGTMTAMAQEDGFNTEGNRFTLGGYGEATMTRQFYSDNYKRYTNADLYKDADSHGQFDLPHVVIYMGYDFGHGWTLGTEIEFEHGGTESAIEIEEEETGEYETEVERGGEVALEQFWLQKSWNRSFNLRMGEIIVPVGGTNGAHMPTEFFTVFRPEGENTIIPCTWHQLGVSLWGYVDKLRYEVQFLEGLEADMFSRDGWIHDGAASAYEFNIANSYATSARIDIFYIPNLRIGLSGYYGTSAANSLKSYKYSDISGAVTIGAIDFLFKPRNWIVRGYADYGHLSDSEQITKINKTLGNNSVSPQQSVASDAYCIGIEAGFDFFSLVPALHKKGEQLYLFGRFDSYDSMYKTEGTVADYKYCERKVYTVGLNYKPIKDIVIKGEYSYRKLKAQFNNEPSISLGIAYSGFFKL